MNKPSSLENFTDKMPSWLIEVLRYSGLSFDNSKNPEVVTGSLYKETIGTGKGFMNRIERITIGDAGTSPKIPASVIVKLPSRDPALISLIEKLGNREREVRFYREIAGQANIHTPGIYFSYIDELTGDTVLVMEDMGNYRQGDSVQGCSIDDAKSAIRELGNFHSGWWENERLDSLDWIPLKDSESDIYGEIYPEAWRMFLEKSGGSITDDLKAMGGKLAGKISYVKGKLTQPPKTLLHGDYRLDNCFLGKSNRSSSIAVFDWEYCVKGRGVFDVATFICEAFPPSERLANEMHLLGLYFDTLTQNGIDGYSWNQCILDYRLAILEVFIFWVVVGGYCDYDDDRGSVFLKNALQRFDAAVRDLKCEELLQDALP